jgi:predicted nucleic acid-binding protein
VRLFLDTSVLLAACGSSKGASRGIFLHAAVNGWVLISTPYVIDEVVRNLPDFPAAASADWARLRPQLLMLDDVLTVAWPTVFTASKDRPILFSALAWADILLTLDRGDFGGLMEKPFYGLLVLKPITFLERERAAGRLK